MKQDTNTWKVQKKAIYQEKDRYMFVFCPNK